MWDSARIEELSLSQPVDHHGRVWEKTAKASLTQCDHLAWKAVPMKETGMRGQGKNNLVTRNLREEKG